MLPNYAVRSRDALQARSFVTGACFCFVEAFASFPLASKRAFVSPVARSISLIALWNIFGDLKKNIALMVPPTVCRDGLWTVFSS
jgi:hypothetical protein